MKIKKKKKVTASTPPGDPFRSGQAYDRTKENLASAQARFQHTVNEIRSRGRTGEMDRAIHLIENVNQILEELLATMDGIWIPEHVTVPTVLVRTQYKSGSMYAKK